MADVLGKTSTKISLSEFLGAARFAPTSHNQPRATGTTPTFASAFVTGGLLSKETTRLSTPANCFLGVADDRWDLAEIWFDRAIVIPCLIEFGNVFSSQSATIFVYSSYRSQSIIFSSLVNNLGAGTSITGLPITPFVMQPQSGFQVTLNVDADGPATINNTLDWTFFPGEVQSVLVTAQRLFVFPLIPEVPLVEVMEFLTDVLEHVDGSEQRIAVRKNPREIFEYRMLVDSEDRQLLENIIYDWQARPFGLPIRTQPAVLTAAASVSDTVISVDDTTFMDIRVDELAIIFTDRFTFDALEIESFTSNSITFKSPLANNYAQDSEVFPLRLALMSATVSGNMAPLNLEELNLTFTVQENNVGDSFADVSAFNSLDGKVLLDGPNAMVSRMPTSWARRMIVFESVAGKRSVDTPWSRGRRANMKGFVTQNRQELFEVRRLLHALRGRQVSFYLPTFNVDVTLTVDLQNGNTAMLIKNVGFSKFAQGRGPSRLIVRVVEIDGTITRRDVVSSGEVDAENETIVVDSGWSSDIAIVDIRRIEFVELVRFNADKIRIEHANSLGQARIQIPVRTVLNEL